MRPLDTRVVVIGAGPAGLSAASTLAEHGFRDVTVLEKESVVGGKCRSLQVDGHAIDLGANLTTPRYHETRALAERLGMTLRKVRDRRIVNLSNETFASLADANLLERLVVRGGASVYAAMRHLTGVDRDGYAGLRDPVEQPFGRWLDQHGLGAFKELFEVLFVAYGYGAMLDLPAAYALKFFDPVHLEASIDTVLGRDVPFTMDFVEGFQELWERVDAQLPRPTIRGATVEAVARSPRGVEVRWTDATGAHQERFDALILACPLQVCGEFLDTSPAEQRLFSTIRTNDYFVTVARTRNLPDLSTYVYPYARRLTPGCPTVFYPPIGRSESGEGDLFVFYAYGGEGIDEDVVRARIRETLAHPSLGGEVVEFVHTQRWRYFPHVDPEAMRGGFYDELEALQGTFHTHYVGELLSFTLVELNRRYARHLVERFFVR